MRGFYYCVIYLNFSLLYFNMKSRSVRDGSDCARDMGVWNMSCSGCML